MNKPSPEDLQARIRRLEEVIERLKSENRENIKENFAKYRRVIDSTSEGFLELDPAFNIVDFNAALVNLLSIDGKTLLNSPFNNLYDKRTLFIHFASKDHLSFEAVSTTQAGKRLPLLFKRSVLRERDGTAHGYFVFITDLTELKKAREDLHEAEIRYRDMYKNAVQGLYQSTLEGRFLRVNPAFARIFGYDHSSQLLFQPKGVINLYKKPKHRQHLLAALKKNKFVTNYEVEMQDKEGNPVWVIINARLTTDSRGETIIEGSLIDNTKKRLAEETLRRSRERFRIMANQDNLTSLYNTRYLYKALDKLIAESDRDDLPFSLVFLDMDNFKQVVDTYGHLNGSQALKEVAATLKANLKEPSFGVAYGGDEFVLILPNTGKDKALRKVQKIRNQMKKTTYLAKKNLEVRLSASFGVATYPDDAGNREELLALADEAMFAIKSRGKDAIGVTAEKTWSATRA
ncbi:MAG: sensor domain-containing diguanylate cyclase [Desulforhopalus sp.]